MWFCTSLGKGIPMNEAFGQKLPEAAIIGLVGDENSGISAHLARLPAHEDIRIVDYALDCRDPLVRLQSACELSEARRHGATILLASWNETLLGNLCDEIWWIENGQVVAKGDPTETLDRWRAHIHARWRAAQSGIAPIEPAMRRGDGRAAVQAIELLDSTGQPVLAWSSGEQAHVRVRIEFLQAVEDPVIGMMIRTRVGLNVYGTNTELEHLKLGPRAAGDQITVSFRFRCELCPGEYTLTIASHDPDGTWHEWLEDAVAFAVGDVRYTAGVANLRANVTWEIETI
jgi:lipopolysaccharide transport system ATP-binding protein